MRLTNNSAKVSIMCGSSLHSSIILIPLSFARYYHHIQSIPTLRSISWPHPFFVIIWTCYCLGSKRKNNAVTDTNGAKISTMSLHYARYHHIQNNPTARLEVSISWPHPFFVIWMYYYQGPKMKQKTATARGNDEKGEHQVCLFCTLPSKYPHIFHSFRRKMKHIINLMKRWVCVHVCIFSKHKKSTPKNEFICIALITVTIIRTKSLTQRWD
jgi:hypothetical protein